MKAGLRGGIIAMSLLGSAGLALAQGVSTSIELTPDQRTTVYRTITKEKIRVTPHAGWRVGVGVQVPESVELYAVPDEVTVPAVRRYRYIVVGDEVVLVDPSTRKVVQIIRE
jgi:hypothetical protein